MNRPWDVIDPFIFVAVSLLVGRVGWRLLNPVMLRSAAPPILMTWMADARPDALGYDHLNELKESRQWSQW